MLTIKAGNTKLLQNVSSSNYLHLKGDTDWTYIRHTIKQNKTGKTKVKILLTYICLQFK